VFHGKAVFYVDEAKTKILGEGVFKHGEPFTGVFPRIMISCGVYSAKDVYKDGQLKGTIQMHDEQRKPHTTLAMKLLSNWQ
jgi:hypothetical protein